MSLEKQLEYASIGFSVLGAVVATTTQQLAYLATPVAFALILNSSNRRNCSDLKLKKVKILPSYRKGKVL
jgi:hypothetical protein